MGAGAAARVAGAVGAFLDGPLPVRIRAWDGSEAGAAPGPGVPTVVLRSRRALRRLLWQPGEMGLAHAYVSGDLDVDGDLAEGLAAMWALVRSGTIAPRRPRVGELPGLAAVALRLGLVGPRPAAPPEAIRIRGRRHSGRRDRDVIAHHYDAGNAFYALLLDDSMAYSSGYWTSEQSTLAQAQHDKLELICRKLELAPGRRLLDIGCCWGSLAVHAAREHGARVRAVTISREQRDHVNARIRAEGLAGQVQVDLLDYRDVAERITAPGRLVRRRQRDRDGRARRRGALPGVRRHAARRPAPRRPGARPADVARSERARRRGVHRDLRDPGHGHAPGRRHADAPGAHGPRGPRRARDARALRDDDPRLARRPGGAVRRGRRAGRRARRPDVAALPRRRRPRVRGEPHGRRPDPPRPPHRPRPQRHARHPGHLVSACPHHHRP
jgi:hypothetical protein